jgi:hypothetical protein
MIFSGSCAAASTAQGRLAAQGPEQENLHAMRTLYQAAVDRADSAIRRETPPPARHGL